MSASPDSRQSSKTAVERIRPYQFKPGQSGNPGGSSARSREYRALIEQQETPEMVAGVVAMLRLRATEDFDIPAAKLYLEAVRVLAKDDDARAERFALRMFEEAIANAEMRRQQAATAIDVTVESAT